MHLAQELARLMDLDQKFAESNKTIEHYKSLLEKHRLEIPEENLHNEDDFMVSFFRVNSTIQKQPSCEKGCSLQISQGEKRCEIKGGGQEMAVMVG